MAADRPRRATRGQRTTPSTAEDEAFWNQPFFQEVEGDAGFDIDAALAQKAAAKAAQLAEEVAGGKRSRPDDDDDDGGGGESSCTTATTTTTTTPQPPPAKHARYIGANFPLDHDGRTYHVGTKPGDVNNRIVIVGDITRARRLGERLTDARSVLSARGLLTISGLFMEIPVSIVCCLMGGPMMDMTIRECRAVVEGPMVICRWGTCGGLSASVGDVCVATDARQIARQVDTFRAGAGTVPVLALPGEGTAHYCISQPVAACAPLHDLLVHNMREALPPQQKVVVGENITADSFYSSQGRTDPNFNDANDALIPTLIAKLPHVQSLEMETFNLFDLALSSSKPVYAGAAALVIAQRTRNEFIDPELKEATEILGGTAILRTVATFEIPA